MKKIILVMAMLAFFTGCAFKSGDELLKAPKASSDYLALQNIIDEKELSGSVLSAPQSGTHRNTVQLVDIDADSTDEAIAFFRDSAVSGDFSVIAYKKDGNSYIEMGSLEGSGTSIDRVDYPKLSPVGGGGIAVSFKISNELERGLTVAQVSDGTLQTVLDTTYMSYLIYDIDADGLDEIFTIKKVQNTPIINMYKMIDGNMKLHSVAYLSVELESVLKMTTGNIVSGSRAIAIDSKVTDGIGVVTDLITLNEEGLLENVTINKETGSAMVTHRAINTFSTKLYDDLIYIPTTTVMKGTESSDVTLTSYVTNWHLYDLYQPVQSDLYTYYTSSEGWYYKLTEEQKDYITIDKSQASNIKITTFNHYINEFNEEVLFEIYVIPREEYIESHFIGSYISLASNATHVYLAKNISTDERYSISDSEILENFELIYSQN